VDNRQNQPSGDLLDRATNALRCVAIPPGPSPQALRRAIDAGLDLHVAPLSPRKPAKKVRRLARFVVAASILLAVGIAISLIAIVGGPPNIAFANVADVLERLRSATFDMTVEMSGQPPISVRAKGLFLAPSRQRIEAARKDDRYGDMVIVADYESAKGIVLLPSQKKAFVVDSEKIRQQLNNPMACMFETMRCLVREGRSHAVKTVTTIGKKEIDGQIAVGFLAHCSMGDMTLWADPRTAKPVRIELDMPAMNAHGVLNNFRYDVPLDPSLFSLEPPPTYQTVAMGVKTPAEEGLIETLRVVAEHRNGLFPPQLGLTRDVMNALQAVAGPDIAAIAASGDEQAAEAILSTLPIEQKYMQGILFFMSLKPKNEPHYAGNGVKLGTPNRPIFWYKPTGAAHYRVIYADLHVKIMTPDDVKKLQPSSGK
jgi:outer membrane lipoprotein-sorting protein